MHKKIAGLMDLPLILTMQTINRKVLKIRNRVLKQRPLPPNRVKISNRKHHLKRTVKVKRNQVKKRLKIKINHRRPQEQIRRTKSSIKVMKMMEIVIIIRTMKVL